MQFVLTGFTQDMGFRVFMFEGVTLDRPRTKTVFTVKADLALIRRYGIQIQELPLLCRAMLDRLDGEETHALVFTEDKMRTCANDRAAARDAAAQKRRPPRKPPTGNLGTAWRGNNEVAAAAAVPGAQVFQVTGRTDIPPR